MGRNLTKPYTVFQIFGLSPEEFLAQRTKSHASLMVKNSELTSIGAS
jgi:hypothetical protein